MLVFTRLFFALSALVVLSACQAQKDPVLNVEGFEPYVQKFEKLSVAYGAPVHINNLIIQYGALQNDLERGVCVMDGDSTPTITIRQDTWEQMSEAEREELLFHEMGHCVLHRAHVSSITSQGLPSSIMNPYLIMGPIYQSYQSYYLNELFRPSR